jgi:tetratricopeptide (TPR) repeat protein
VKNSELVRILARIQKTLRNTIRAKPTFVPAYLALAETFLVTERKSGGDALREEEGRQIFKTDYEKAINVLKTVPSPDEKVMSQLAQYLEAAGKKDEAAQYLERLVLMRPTSEVFFRLVSNYVDRKDPSLNFLLDKDIPQPDERFKDRHAVLLSLRKNFEVLPEHEGLRHALIGVVLGREEAQTTNEALRRQLREKMISQYELALEAYQSRTLPVPAVLFNNLAWYLAESDDAPRRGRAVELAKRGLGLHVESPGRAAVALDFRQMPDMHDTYAWALHRNGRHLEAEQILRELIKAADRPVYRYHLAHVLLALKKFDEALAEVQTARESPAPFPEEAGARRLEAEIRSEREKAIGR